MQKLIIELNRTLVLHKDLRNLVTSFSKEHLHLEMKIIQTIENEKLSDLFKSDLISQKMDEIIYLDRIKSLAAKHRNSLIRCIELTRILYTCIKADDKNTYLKDKYLLKLNECSYGIEYCYYSFINELNRFIAKARVNQFRLNQNTINEYLNSGYLNELKNKKNKKNAA